jgi:uncharacterized protein (DUF885 family)
MDYRGGCTMITGIVLTRGKNPSVEDIIKDLKGLPIDEFFDKSFNQLLLRDPQGITQLGLSKVFGLRNDQLTNMSDTYIKETQALEAGILELLRGYDPSELTKEQQISYDVYEWYLDDLVRGHQFMYYTYVVHHFLTSYHDDLVRFFTHIHPLTTREDAQDYVTRMSQVGTQVDQVIEGLNRSKKAGVLLPEVILEKTINQLIKYYTVEAGDGKALSVYTAFKEKVKKIDMPEKDRHNLLDAVAAEIEKSFIPGIKRLLTCLESLKMSAPDAVGVWQVPRGDEYYQYLLRKATSTELTPEEIHEIGLKEVDRIQKEMYNVFAELGYPDDGLTTLTERAAEEGGFIDTRMPSGGDAVIKTYETILDEITNLLDAVLDIRPIAQLAIVGEPYGGGGGFFVHGSADGSRPGAFHTGVGPPSVYTYRMPTIAYHEAIPGHYFQITIAQELDLPLFRNIVLLNGYVEGWGMYAEQLAYELGVYKDNLYGNIGRLQLELLRAVRLVVDTGIHALQWSREKALQYMEKALGSNVYSSEVDRFIVIPGQATGYKIGMIYLLELRQRVMDALGDHFDIKEFHRVVLENGSMPLALLEKMVQTYIDAKMGT